MNATVGQLLRFVRAAKDRTGSDRKFMMKVAIIIVMMINTLVRCQDKPRVGQDGRPLLNKPKVDMCMSRPYHETYGNHHYFLSWREPWNKFEDWDWFNAR